MATPFSSSLLATKDSSISRPSKNVSLGPLDHLRKVSSPVLRKSGSEPSLWADRLNSPRIKRGSSTRDFHLPSVSEDSLSTPSPTFTEPSPTRSIVFEDNMARNRWLNEELSLAEMLKETGPDLEVQTKVEESPKVRTSSSWSSLKRSIGSMGSMRRTPSKQSISSPNSFLSPNSPHTPTPAPSRPNGPREAMQPRDSPGPMKSRNSRQGRHRARLSLQQDTDDTMDTSSTLEAHPEEDEEGLNQEAANFVNTSATRQATREEEEEKEVLIEESASPLPKKFSQELALYEDDSMEDTIPAHAEHSPITRENSPEKASEQQQNQLIDMAATYDESNVLPAHPAKPSISSEDTTCADTRPSQLSKLDAVTTYPKPGANYSSYTVIGVPLPNAAQVSKHGKSSVRPRAPTPSDPRPGQIQERRSSGTSLSSSIYDGMPVIEPYQEARNSRGDASQGSFYYSAQNSFSTPVREFQQVRDATSDIFQASSSYSVQEPSSSPFKTPFQQNEDTSSGVPRSSSMDSERELSQTPIKEPSQQVRKTISETSEDESSYSVQEPFLAPVKGSIEQFRRRSGGIPRSPSFYSGQELAAMPTTEKILPLRQRSSRSESSQDSRDSESLEEEIQGIFKQEYESRPSAALRKSFDEEYSAQDIPFQKSVTSSTEADYEESDEFDVEVEALKKRLGNKAPTKEMWDSLLLDPDRPRKLTNRRSNALGITIPGQDRLAPQVPARPRAYEQGPFRKTGLQTSSGPPPKDRLKTPPRGYRHGRLFTSPPQQVKARMFTPPLQVRPRFTSHALQISAKQYPGLPRPFNSILSIDTNSSSGSPRSDGPPYASRSPGIPVPVWRKQRVKDEDKDPEALIHEILTNIRVGEAEAVIRKVSGSRSVSMPAALEVGGRRQTSTATAPLSAAAKPRQTSLLSTRAEKQQPFRLQSSLFSRNLLSIPEDGDNDETVVNTKRLVSNSHSILTTYPKHPTILKSRIPLPSEIFPYFSREERQACEENVYAKARGCSKHDDCTDCTNAAFAEEELKIMSTAIPSEERAKIIANNKSLRTIKNELDSLYENGLIDDAQYETITKTLPAESSLSAGARRSATPLVPTSAASPTPLHAAVSNLRINNDVAPPAYNASTGRAPPPALPSRTPSAPPARPVIKYAVSLYEYNGAPEDCSFPAHENLEILEEMNPEWYFGRNPRTGKEGLFPANFVQVTLKPLNNPGIYVPYNENEKVHSYGGQYPNQYQQGPLSPGPANPYNSDVPPMAVAGQPSHPAQPSKGAEMGKKFGKKLGNAAIFGAGATMGADLVNSIF